MSKRILIDVDPVLELSDDASESTRAVFTLADELNDALPGIECTFVHLDTGNYLAFVERAQESTPDADELDALSKA
jgi:hypothetical protein